MFELFLLSLGRYLRLAALALAAPFTPGRRLAGALLVIAATPLFLVWQLAHWAGFLLDELLFRGYRRVAVREPLFIVGPPRTGTTHLHQVMSRDASTTTFRLWECLFALSVTGRRLCLGLAALDRAAGRPLGRAAAWAGRRLFGSMDDIHPLGLGEPEEDFLSLMPLAACFLLAIPYPGAGWLWRTARLDTAVSPREQALLMRYYRRCIQRHLYVFGQDRRFLSKNASFAGSIRSLLGEFPDAKILGTARDPLDTVPSQLSAIRPGLAAVGYPDVPDALKDDLVELMRHYYEHLAECAEAYPERIAILYNYELRDTLAESVSRAMAALDIETTPAFRSALEESARASREFASSHDYSLGEFGLDEKAVRTRFSQIYLRYNFRNGLREAEQP